MDLQNGKAGFRRRAFVAGLLGGLGVAGTVLAAAPQQPKGPREDARQGPVLYRRTREVERYFKTLTY